MASLAGRKYRNRISFLIVMILFTTGVVRAQGVQEYQVKAVFLYHFTQFVDWPESSFEDSTEPFVIGVLGEDPFGSFLDAAVRGETVGGHAVEVRRLDGPASAGACHILFVSEFEGRGVARLLRSLAGRPVLTVSDAEDFAEAGGIVQFVTRRGKVVFRINVDSAQAAGLTISSKLLSLAEIVSGEED